MYETLWFLKIFQEFQEASASLTGMKWVKANPIKSCASIDSAYCRTFFGRKKFWKTSLEFFSANVFYYCFGQKDLYYISAYIYMWQKSVNKQKMQNLELRNLHQLLVPISYNQTLQYTKGIKYSSIDERNRLYTTCDRVQYLQAIY